MQVITPKDLGALVAEYRLGLGLSQSELAARIGVGRGWVGRLEAGAPGAEIGLVLRAIRVLGIRLIVAPPGNHDAG